MDIFNVLNMIGGLSLFLFGMTVMGQALERRAGAKLRTLLEKMTAGKLAGFATGLCITAVIQSSSATTVMVVGFVNSGIMTLRQAINVIMGANVGTTATAWLLSLAGISGSSLWVRLLKPASFTPVLALFGVIFYMFSKSSRRRDTGLIMLGFVTLMFGMETMSASVSGLGKLPAFRELFLMFKNPVLAVLAGALLTAIIQSSSASVGILQALAMTGQVQYVAAIPIIMGQNIGTCVTALIASVGTNTNAKRAAAVHLSFNVIGTVIGLILFVAMRAIFAPAFLTHSATMYGIAIAHSVFNILCTALLLPASGLLEKLVVRFIPSSEDDDEEEFKKIDSRLFLTPAIALEQCRVYSVKMGEYAVKALKNALLILPEYDTKRAQKVSKYEDKTDKYEDILNTALLKVNSSKLLDRAGSEQVTELLKVIGDFERIGDHAINILEARERLKDMGLSFTDTAMKELAVLCSAVCEVIDLTFNAFTENNVEMAQKVEPLEQVVDNLKEQLRTNHILRMKQGECNVEAGFIWSDILTDLERVSDHCSNIAGYIIDMQEHNMNLHTTLEEYRRDTEQFKKLYHEYARKYSVGQNGALAQEAAQQA